MYLAYVYVHGQLSEKTITILITMRDGISDCLLSYFTFTKTLRGKIQSSPLLQKSKLRHKKVKELTQEHTARTSLVAQ